MRPRIRANLGSNGYQIGILLGNAKRSISHMRGLLYVPEVILEQERRFRAEKVAADLTECEYTATGCPHADQLERLDHSLQLETEVKSPVVPCCLCGT